MIHLYKVRDQVEPRNTLFRHALFIIKSRRKTKIITKFGVVVTSVRGMVLGRGLQVMGKVLYLKPGVRYMGIYFSVFLNTIFLSI